MEVSKTETIHVRMETHRLRKLQDLANELGIDRSQLIREMIDSTRVSGESRLLVGSQK